MNQIQPNDSYIVSWWCKSLDFLAKLSVFELVRYLLFEKLKVTKFSTHFFVDTWVLLHSILALTFVVVAYFEQVPNYLKYSFLIYGCIRVFEILIYQLKVILVDPYKATNTKYELHSYRRMTIALIHNFFEIIFWFAGTFLTLQFVSGMDPGMAIYQSFIHMVTFSIDIDDGKWSILALTILLAQALIGVFMTVLSLARFVSLFPQPASKDASEQEANNIRHEQISRDISSLSSKVDANTTTIQINQQSIQELQKINAKLDELLQTYKQPH